MAVGWKLLSLVLILGFQVAAAPLQVYVSPSGDDHSTGTEVQPLSTLHAARDAVRQLRQDGHNGSVEVILMPGVYHLDAPLVLEPVDSGTAEGPTIYRAAQGGRVSLSGGVPITGWERRSDGVWSAPVPEGMDFRLLRVGDRWATRARYPNADPKHPYTGGWLFADAVEPVPPTGTPMTTMRYREGDLPAVDDVAGAEVHIFIAWSWVNAILPLERHDPEDRRLIFAGQGATQDVRVGNRYFIENLREALDAPGEWFLDKSTGEVLYIPDDPAFPELPVVAPQLDYLIRLSGDPANDRFVEHVHFVGLHFTDTTYTLTTNYYSPQDACIVMAGARHCELRQNEFSWLGGYAVKLQNQSRHCVVAENRMHHLGQGGVIGVGDARTQSRDCTIVANDMSYLGQIYKHVAGVYIVSGSDHYIAHNRITEVPRYGISLKSLHEGFYSHRNVIEFNDIRRSNLETNDTGAIETLGRDKADSGNVIRHNLILDSVGMNTTPEGKIISPHYTWGIYLDDFSSGTTVYGNIVARTPTGSLCINGGHNNLFENNIFVDGHQRQVHIAEQPDFAIKGNRFLRNIVAYSRAEAEIIYILGADPRPKRNSPGPFDVCDHNLYWLSSSDLRSRLFNVMPEGPFRVWVARGFDRSSKVADPQFVNWATDDYRIAPSSPAFDLGFERIPTELIGPQGWQMRNQSPHTAP